MTEQQQGKLPKPPKSGGDMTYRETHKAFNNRTVRYKKERYSWGELIVERRYSKATEWIHIEPTVNQPDSLLIVTRRIPMTRQALRFVSAMYYNKAIQVEERAVTQSHSFATWLNHCVKFGIETRRPYSDLLYTLRFMIDRGDFGTLEMPKYDAAGNMEL